MQACSVQGKITCAWKDNLWLLDTLDLKIIRNLASWKSVQMTVISMDQVFISSLPSFHLV